MVPPTLVLLSPNFTLIHSVRQHNMTAMLSLYGIEMFMVKQRCELRVTRTDTATVLWKNSPNRSITAVHFSPHPPRNLPTSRPHP